MDFILAYTQAPTENGLYMKLPKGVEMRQGNGIIHVLIFKPISEWQLMGATDDLKTISHAAVDLKVSTYDFHII